MPTLQTGEEKPDKAVRVGHTNTSVSWMRFEKLLSQRQICCLLHLFCVEKDGHKGLLWKATAILNYNLND